MTKHQVSCFFSDSQCRSWSSSLT